MDVGKAVYHNIYALAVSGAQTFRVEFQGQEISLILSLSSRAHNFPDFQSGGANVEEFIAKTQRATKLALKPYVGPFLASYLPLLQKEITVKAANVRMSSSRCVASSRTGDQISTFSFFHF